jgi:tRNA1Val (adenine37-N6)-methyltransferase
MDATQTNARLLPGETLEDLGNGRWIIQHPDVFAFGTDAVLLAHFAQTTGAERAADLGTGTGILPLLMCARNPELVITGLEIQPRPAEMALRSVELNGLEGRVNIVCGDLKAAPRLVGRGLDVVVSNPPYERAGSGKPSGKAHVDIAKREVCCMLEDVVDAAAALLRTGGRLYMIYRAERFAELMQRMREARVEPKRIQLVCQHANEAPNFALVEGRKGAGPGLAFLPHTHRQHGGHYAAGTAYPEGSGFYRGGGHAPHPRVAFAPRYPYQAGELPRAQYAGKARMAN